jgi:hypothetical protein
MIKIIQKSVITGADFRAAEARGGRARVEHVVNSGRVSVYAGVVRLVVDCWEKNVSEGSSATKVLDPWAYIRLGAFSKLVHNGIEVPTQDDKLTQVMTCCDPCTEHIVEIIMRGSFPSDSSGE